MISFLTLVRRRWRSLFIMVLTPIIILLVETTAMAAEFIPNHEPDPDAPSGALSNLLIRGSIVEGDAERPAPLRPAHVVHRNDA